MEGIQIITEGELGTRPSWDEYFMKVAIAISSRASCYNVQAGSVVTLNNQVIATGYNGAPHGVKNCLEYGRCYKEIQTNQDYSNQMNSGRCIGVHSEINALAHLTKLSHNGATLYVTIFPCTSCTKALLAYGIKRIVFKKIYDQRELITSMNMLKQANVEICQLDISPKRVLDIDFNHGGKRFDVWTKEEKEEVTNILKQDTTTQNNSVGVEKDFREVRLGRYQHFKGQFYEVIGTGKHSETREEFVVYKALYDHSEFGNNALWVRPKSMFLEIIERDGKTIERFKFVGEGNKIDKIDTMNTMDKIILATTSPYRKAAFEFLGLDFIAEGSNVDEYFDGRPDSPEDLVKHLAKLKAEAVAKNHSQGIVIGFDSAGYFNGKIFEKPKSRQEAYERLKALSGKTHEFYTGIHMINLNTSKIISRVVKTEALFRELSEEEINNYLDQDKEIWMNAATGYDTLENSSCSFVKSINGSYNNITRGIPLENIVEMLKEIKSH